MQRILVINPGSTSTKIAVFDDAQQNFESVLRHSPDDLTATDTDAQLAFRTRVIDEALKENGIAYDTLTAVIGRGGLMRPVAGGVYRINDAMVNDLRTKKYGDHASNLGALLARGIADRLNIPSYTADPVVVDELCELARISGCPDIARMTKFHALNQKAVARRYAKSVNKEYGELCLIVAHMGGGISIGAHEYGRIIDCNNAWDGDGPFSAGRAGGLPTGGVVELCYSGRFASKEEAIRYFTSQCGLMGYLGTTSGTDVSRRASSGDERAKLIYSAMAYQVSKEIGAAAAALSGSADAVILTGGFAYDKLFTGWISDRVSFIAPVVIMPGEDEMTALMEAARRALSGGEEVKEY